MSSLCWSRACLLLEKSESRPGLLCPNLVLRPLVRLLRSRATLLTLPCPWVPTADLRFPRWLSECAAMVSRIVLARPANCACRVLKSELLTAFGVDELR